MDGSGDSPIGMKDGRLHLGDNVLTGPVTAWEVFDQLVRGTRWEQSVDWLRANQSMVLVSLVVGVLVVLFFMFWGAESESSDNDGQIGGPNTAKKGSVAEVEPPRDFTVDQLREFDGSKEDGPIYISLRGDVYDVSGSRRDFYGKGMPYNCFCGREASVAMAKMSFEEKDLANVQISDLNPMQLSTLDDWISKFRDYKCYPIVGRCTVPPASQDFKRSDLAAFKGNSGRAVPEGRVDAPIYLCLSGRVFDVSYGGKENYGPDGPYLCLTGIDASRALAKMSFDPNDLASSDLSDLNEAQTKALGDWLARMNKKYPAVGVLID